MEAIQAMAVTQLKTKKNQITDLGYTEDEAETIQTIVGGWVEAHKLAQKIELAYFRKVIANHATREIRRAALLQLTEHYYNLAGVFVVNHGGNLEGMISKGLNNKLVDGMTGAPVPPLRALVLAMSSNPLFTDISKLGKVCDNYPGFVAILSAQLGAGAALQDVMSWLGGQTAATLAWLNTNLPTFATLQVLTAQDPGSDLLKMLCNFAKEVAPAAAAYEQIGLQQQNYRIGHFARAHTLRGMPAVPALDGGKTLWPAATTVAEVRAVCGDLDANHAIAANTRVDLFYTPTVQPATPIRARKNLDNNHFDQLYPTSGPDISAGDATKLGVINASKHDWTVGPA